MIETLGEDYVRTARAKGSRNGAVVVRHALRAAIVPIVTIFGLDLAFLLSGTVFTEKIFQLDGIGRVGASTPSSLASRLPGRLGDRRWSSRCSWWAPT